MCECERAAHTTKCTNNKNIPFLFARRSNKNNGQYDWNNAIVLQLVFVCRTTFFVHCRRRHRHRRQRIQFLCVFVWSQLFFRIPKIGVLTPHLRMRTK